MDSCSFDIIVSNISFVVHRETDGNWSRVNLTNPHSFLLIFAAAGNAEYEVEGENFTVAEGDILFFNKGQPHTGFSNPQNPWTYYTVAFEAVSNDGKLLEILDIPLLIHSENPEFYRQLYETLRYEWSLRKLGYHILCRAMVSEIICALIRESANDRKQSPNIEMVKRYMVENFAKEFSVKELSAMAGVSPPHFHRLFKENTGLSVIRYLNTVRINKARDLLKSGEHNITEVAYNVGICDVYYFSRLFKKMTGKPPSSYILKRKK